MRVVSELRPEIPPRRLDEWESWWVYDVGANVVGRCGVRGRGRRGSTLVLRHGEALHPDGSVYLDNLGDARQTDAYTFSGEGVEAGSPRSRARLQVRTGGGAGCRGPARASRTRAALRPEEDGNLSCSHPLLERLYANIVRSIEGNLVDVPTDRPQRDERLGWTSDLQLVLPAAEYTFDLSRFLEKWLVDPELGQSEDGSYPPVAPDIGFFGMSDGGPGWADAAVICAWRHYVLYGDERVLRSHYPALVRYVDYVERTLVGGVRAHPDSPHFRGFGDWLTPVDALQAPEGGAAEVETPLDLIGTAYLAHVTGLMSRIAAALNLPADARRFAGAASHAARLRARFCSPDGVLAVYSQTAHVLALRFGLLERGAMAPTAAALVELLRRRGTRLSTGFLGSAHILDVLSDAGHVAVAYDVLLQTKFPSWLFQVLNGATTVWERWDGWTPESGFQDRTMNSLNHHVLGAVGAWMYRVIAGIGVDEQGAAGFGRALLAPLPGGGLTWASGRTKRRTGAWRAPGR